MHDLIFALKMARITLKPSWSNAVYLYNSLNVWILLRIWNSLSTELIKLFLEFDSNKISYIRLEKWDFNIFGYFDIFGLEKYHLKKFDITS